MNVELKNHLIDKYRESIKARYNYDVVKKDKRFPRMFTRETVDELRDFFLENLYSPPAQREKLDAAFKQLETYIAHPTKVWGLLGNLASAIFQFGFHFPAALRTGMTALQTHTTARHFEDMLLQAAIDRNYTVPLTEEQFNECLASLDSEMLQKFIGELTELFMAITDTSLLEKTIHILKDVLKRMMERKDLYGPEDHDAIQLGVDILQQGYELLSKYDAETKTAIVEFVTYSEIGFIESLKPGGKKKRSTKKD
jgi:hypothetical protein